MTTATDSQADIATIAYLGLTAWAKHYQDALPLNVFVSTNADTWLLNFKGCGASSRYPANFLPAARAFLQAWVGLAATKLGKPQPWVIVDRVSIGDPFNMGRLDLYAIDLGDMAAAGTHGLTETTRMHRFEHLPFDTEDQAWLNDTARAIFDLLNS